MPTVLKFRKLLHRKQWSMVANGPGTNVVAGQSTTQSRLHDQRIYQLIAATGLHLYDPFEDGWGSMVSPALGTFGAGAATTASATGPSGTATAGTTTTLTTNLTIPGDLRGYKIRITGGPGAGSERTIVSNTLGANSVIAVDSPFSAAITSASTYTLLTGMVYLFGGGTLGASSFRVFDCALQTYTSLSIAGLPASFGTDADLTATSSIISRGVVTSFATGTATSATSTTLTNASKAWATNQWANAFQVRITGGTGAGQTRRIASNTGTTLTVAAWTTTPDATSIYSIEGDDDSLYLSGNGSTGLYRYSRSTNTWTTLAARGGGTFAGGRLCWITGSPASDWNVENAIINGRRLYSPRGGSANIDYYDIPSNTWTTFIPGPVSATFIAGTRTIDYNGAIYIRDTSSSVGTARMWRYDCATNLVLPWHNFPVLTVSPAVGTLMWIAEFVDGTTVIPYLYCPWDNASGLGAVFRTPIV